MELRRGFKAYITGWTMFIGSVLYVILWQLIVALPILLFAIVLPDHLEGKAAGAWLVRGSVLAVMVLWVPLISYKLGMLMFETDSDRGKPGKRKEPEVEILRRIAATQERRDKTGEERHDTK